MFISSISLCEKIEKFNDDQCTNLLKLIADAAKCENVNELIAKLLMNRMHFSNATIKEMDTFCDEIIETRDGNSLISNSSCTKM